MVALTSDLEQALERSLQLAKERKHEYATLEHLLLALVDDKDAAEVIAACQVDMEQLRRRIFDYLENECGSFVVEDGRDVHPTAAFQRVIQRAVLHVESSLQDVVTGANVLVSMFAERDSHAVEFLQEQDMTRYKAVSYLSYGVPEAPGQPSDRTAEEEETRERLEAAVRQRLADTRNRLRDELTKQRGADVPPFYLIRIRGIELSASIGVHDFEQATPQRLLVSVALILPQPKPGDEIAQVQDYDFVREDVLDLVEKRHFNLQETLCGAILDLCLAQKDVLGAVVQTDKPDVYPGVAGVACRMARMGPRLSGFPWWTIEL